MASKSSFMSTPDFFAIIMASPIAQSCTAHSMLVRILTTVSWPNWPHLTMRGADRDMRSFTCWKVSSSAPTRDTIFPTFRICMPPVRGAATALAPRFSTSARILRVFSKSVVECSIQIDPGCKPARMPLSPIPSSVMPMAADTCSGRGRPVITTSHCSARARGESAHVAPCSRKGAATDRPLMSWRTGLRPARIRFPVTAWPSWPMPTMPTRPGLGQLMAAPAMARHRHAAGGRACRRRARRVAADRIMPAPQESGGATRGDGRERGRAVCLGPRA
mmetsp:Transcript_102148/g.289270  ORF Transcript_102148/g.289270 Transcript_102148/m.289270 type:complete len:276 (-) Transcript_102148:7-834(-)